MTNKEAAVLMARLVAAFPATKASEETFAVYLDYLAPLPFAWTERAVEHLILSHPYPSLPAIADLMYAASIKDDDARTQFLTAMWERKQLVRDAASVTGWAVGEAAYPPDALPQEVPALPGPVVSEEKRRSLLGMVKSLGGALGRSGGESW